MVKYYFYDVCVYDDEKLISFMIIRVILYFKKIYMKLFVFRYDCVLRVFIQIFFFVLSWVIILIFELMIFFQYIINYEKIIQQVVVENIGNG